MSKKIIPDLPTPILGTLSGLQNDWAKRVPSGIEQLNELAARLPEKYNWRFRDTEAFKRELKAIRAAASDPLTINQFYWRDMLGSAEAFALLSVWRGVDLARGFVRALAVDDLICAAIVSRAALENTAFFIDAARTISATIGGSSGQAGGLLDPSKDPKAQILTSLDLEKFLLKTVFASRLPRDEDLYSPTNVLTIIQRLTKTPTQENLFPTYEILCEVAHPNFFGKSVYLLDREFKDGPGDEVRTIGLGAGPTSAQVLEAALGALSWSCAGVASAFFLQAQALRAAARRFGIGSNLAIN